MTQPIRFIVQVTIDQDSEEARAEFAQLFGQYLTTVSYPFLEDYGKSAWGGYDGPKVTAVRVNSDYQSHGYELIELEEENTK